MLHPDLLRLLLSTEPTRERIDSPAFPAGLFF